MHFKNLHANHVINSNRPKYSNDSDYEDSTESDEYSHQVSSCDKKLHEALIESLSNSSLSFKSDDSNSTNCKKNISQAVLPPELDKLSLEKTISSLKITGNDYEVACLSNYFENNRKREVAAAESALLNFDYQYFSVYELLKNHKPLKAANIIAKRHHSNFYTNDPKLDDSYHIVSSLLSDKIYQLHVEHNYKVVSCQERALNLIFHGITEYSGWDATKEEVWQGLAESIPIIVNELVSFAKEIPGLNELNSHDFGTIINNKVFDFFTLRHCPLFINEESFMMLPNDIQYTRRWMLRIIGAEMTNALFEFTRKLNALRLTAKETALMYPLILTGDIYGKLLEMVLAGIFFFIINLI